MSYTDDVVYALRGIIFDYSQHAMIQRSLLEENSSLIALLHLMSEEEKKRSCTDLVKLNEINRIAEENKFLFTETEDCVIDEDIFQRLSFVEKQVKSLLKNNSCCQEKNRFMQNYINAYRADFELYIPECNWFLVEALREGKYEVD